VGKADATGSCTSSSGTLCGAQGSGTCFCDDKCGQYGDCCSDYKQICSGNGDNGVDKYFADDTANTAFPYAVSSEGDAAPCDLYVDSFGILSVWNYYHAAHSAIIVELVSAIDGVVMGAGMSARMDDRVTRSGSVVAEELAREEVFSFGKREGSRFTGNLLLSSDLTDGTEARRTMREFKFFVDVKQGDGSAKRLWFKPASGRFTPADYDQKSYYYSDPVQSGEGSSASIRYLWRDSGSPLFSARQVCLGL
jgi:hypothetical protein